MKGQSHAYTLPSVHAENTFADNAKIGSWTKDSAQGWMMNDSGKWMYYENGRAVTGTKKIGDETYTFDQYGELARINDKTIFSKSKAKKTHYC